MNTLIRKNKHNRYNVEIDETLDGLLANLLINKTLGEIAYIGETSNNMKTNTCCILIYNAIFGSVKESMNDVFNPDINLINELIKRVDGAVPDAEERDQYANLIGDELDKVLQMEPEHACAIMLDEPALTGLSKAVIQIALNQNVGKNAAKKRERQTATEILLSRIGGRKNKPELTKLTTKYVEPEWARQISEGDKNE